MTKFFAEIWESLLRLSWLRRKRAQVAALCYRDTARGKDVLLITSRGTGRWIVPKGWPIDGLDAPAAALQEAWEEAGVRPARIDRSPVGSFDYVKGFDDGGSAPVRAQVYLTEVAKLADTYPESKSRKRKWVSADEAARMVQEPGLKAILRDL